MNIFTTIRRFFNKFFVNNKEIHIYDIFGIKISTCKAKNLVKSITVLSAFPKGEQNGYNYLDIRMYFNDVATERGAMLTEKEYNWLIKKLQNPISDKIICPISSFNILETKELEIHPSRNGVILQQNYGGKYHSIYLFDFEIEYIVKNFDTFDKILGVFEYNIK